MSSAHLAAALEKSQAGIVGGTGSAIAVRDGRDVFVRGHATPPCFCLAIAIRSLQPGTKMVPLAAPG